MCRMSAQPLHTNKVTLLVSLGAMSVACIALIAHPSWCTLNPAPCRRRQLDDDFRLQYARMWQALVMADEAGIRSAAAGMGAGDTAELFAGVLTQRPWSQVSSTLTVKTCSLNLSTSPLQRCADTAPLTSGKLGLQPQSRPSLWSIRHHRMACLACCGAVHQCVIVYLQVVERSSDHLRVGRGGEEERQLLNE
jgi:hypothetical protein